MIVAASIGSTVAGYKIERLLWTTAGGATYAARSPAGDRLVALELISQESVGGAGAIERIERASERATGLGHPNIAVVEAMTAGEGVLYLATRYSAGLDLATLTHRLGALSRRRALDLILQVADALDAAHAAGIVHGSLEPARVLVAREDDRDQVIVSGFGFATEDIEADDPDGPSSGPLPAAYAAPERIRGQIGSAGDVYALACVLVESLWGRPPFPRETDEAMLEAHLSDSPPRLHALAPEVPLYLDEAIAGALSKDPADRPGSAGEFARSAQPGGPDAGAAADETPEAQKQRVVSHWERSIAAGVWSPSEPILAPGHTPDEEAEEETEVTEDDAHPEAAADPEPASTPGPAPARSHRSGGNGRRRVRIGAGVVAVLAAGALAVILTTSGDDDSGSAPARDRAPQAQPPDAPAEPVTPPSTPPAEARLSPWPDRSAYTVIVYVADSSADPVARTRARRAARLGFPAGVLDSSRYSSLDPGRFVAFAGTFLSRRSAGRAAVRLREEGVAAAPYVRFVNGGG